MAYYTPVTKAVKDVNVAKNMKKVMPFITPLFDILSSILEPSGWNDKANATNKRDIGTAVGEIIVNVACELQSKCDTPFKMDDVATDIRTRVHNTTGWKFPCKEWKQCSEFMAIYCYTLASKSDTIKAEEPVDLVDLKGKIDILQNHDLHEIKTGQPIIEDLLQVMAYYDALKEKDRTVERIHLIYIQCQTEVVIDMIKLGKLNSYKKCHLIGCVTFNGL